MAQYAGGDEARLTDLVQTSIERDTWRKYGGQGDCYMAGGVMIVQQAPGVQAKVARLFQQLRQRGASAPPPRGAQDSGEITSIRPLEKEILQLAAEPIAAMRFENEPLSDALGRLAVAARVPIEVRPLPFEIDPLKLRVSASIPAGALSEGLSAVLRTASGPGLSPQVLTWWPGDGWISVGMVGERPEGALFTRTYDVRDLIREQLSAILKLPEEMPTQSSLFTLEEERVGSIERALQRFFRNQLFMGESDQQCHFSVWAGRLVVTARPEVHQRLEQLLEKMRTHAARPSTQPASRPSAPPSTSMYKPENIP